MEPWTNCRAIPILVIVRADVEIREFVQQDQEETKALILDGLRSHWGTLDPAFNRDLDDMSTSFVSGRTFVAVQHGVIVGTGTLLPHDKQTVRIVRMSVNESSQQTGIGRMLVAALVNTAREWGCTELVVETSSHWTGVVAFYRRCGFTETHEVEGEFGQDTWFRMGL
jgi:GNAT superfamily N-acetyltransferase